jgi:predicted phosphoribosyltransferase
MSARFRDREHAGRKLATLLARFADRDDTIVLALPRGGVPVAAAVARALASPMDVFVVRKVGVPGREELAMGAIATGGVSIVNEAVVDQLGITEAVFRAEAARAVAELRRREALYRGDRPAVAARGRVAILVDDGMATGSTMIAAVAAVRRLEPATVVVAVPVAAADVAARLRELADQVVSVSEPMDLEGVSLWYDDFAQTTDDEVRATLDAVRDRTVRSDEPDAEPDP